MLPFLLGDLTSFLKFLLLWLDYFKIINYVVVIHSGCFNLFQLDEIEFESSPLDSFLLSNGNKVTYVDLIAKDTVDEHIVQALRNKINIASQVLGEELKEWIK